MIRSMTGFASRVITLALDGENRANLAVSLKSLNSRFFEATCRLPYQLNNLETTLIKQLNKKLYRGHVYLTIHVDNQAIFKGTVTPACNVVQGYIDAVDFIKKKHAITGELTVGHMIQLPNVFSIEELALDEEAKNLITTTIDELTDLLIEAQCKEGVLLAQDIHERVERMSQIIERIAQASQVLIEAQKAKITATLQELVADESKQAELHKNAAYTLLDKMDIHEEIVRFKMHLKSLDEQLISSGVEKGKRIDFTLQELAREINTITAKCCDAAIGSMGIDIKVELEKAREQAQNIV